MPKTERGWATGVGVSVFIAQLLFLYGIHLLLVPYSGSITHLSSQQDSEYIPLAHSILSGHFELPQYYFPTNVAPSPETFRTPGYPFYIAVIFTLFGGSHYNPGHAQPDFAFYMLLVSLAFLGALTSMLIYLIGRELGFTRRVSTAAGLLFGVSPAVIFLPVTGLGSDMLYVFLFTLATYLAVRLRNMHYPLAWAAGVGIVLGLGALTRPVGLYTSIIMILAIPFLAGFSVRGAKSKDFKQAALLTGIGLAAFFLTLLPWLARNEIVAKHFSLSSIPVYSAADYNIPMFLSFHNHTDEEAEREKIMQSVGNPDPYTLRGFAYTDVLKKIDIDFLHQYLFPYGVFHAIKMGPFFLGSGIDVDYSVVAIEGHLPKISFLPQKDENLSTLLYQGQWREVLNNLTSFLPSTFERLVWVALFLLTFAAPFFARGRMRAFFVLGILLILTAAVLASPVAMPRYRIPVEPFIWLAALYALNALVQKTARWWKPLLFGKAGSGHAEFWRYLIASVAALVLDTTLLLALSHFGLQYIIAATIGFLAGLALIYLLSIKWIFANRTGHTPTREMLLFFGIGIVGLGVNDLVIFLAVSELHLPLILAKACAVIFTFLWNFLARKSILFR